MNEKLGPEAPIPPRSMTEFDMTQYDPLPDPHIEASGSDGSRLPNPLGWLGNIVLSILGDLKRHDPVQRHARDIAELKTDDLQN